MTTKLILTGIAALVFIVACNNKKIDASALNDPQQQDALLDSIAGNSGLLQKVNERAKDKSSMMGMMENPAMINQMMDMMMKQCEKDTAMLRQTCAKMMGNPIMKDMMRRMLESDKSKNAAPNGKLEMELHK